MADCLSIQKSLAWCQGRPELPGVKRRVYYISKSEILQWPTLPHDANGRLTGVAYSGNFVLRSDSTWKFIDIIPDKSQLTSDPQGEYPSQTQLNKLVAVHPAVDAQGTEAAAYLNNNDNVFLVEDMRGAFRVVGSDKWLTKTTVNQDLGQGATGTASTTINVEASDECPAPFYNGEIVTDDGTTSGTSSGNSGSSSSGGSSSGGSSTAIASYDNTVSINGGSSNVSSSPLTLNSPLTSLQFTGSNMLAIFIRNTSTNEEEEAEINSARNQATWTGNISSGSVQIVKMSGTAEDPVSVNWFTINISSNNGSGGSAGFETGG